VVAISFEPAKNTKEYIIFFIRRLPPRNHGLYERCLALAIAVIIARYHQIADQRRRVLVILPKWKELFAAMRNKLFE
jgi:hypothetical protein